MGQKEHPALQLSLVNKHILQKYHQRFQPSPIQIPEV